MDGSKLQKEETPGPWAPSGADPGRKGLRPAGQVCRLGARRELVGKQLACKKRDDLKKTNSLFLLKLSGMGQGLWRDRVPELEFRASSKHPNHGSSQQAHLLGQAEIGLTSLQNPLLLTLSGNHKTWLGEGMWVWGLDSHVLCHGSIRRVAARQPELPGPAFKSCECSAGCERLRRCLTTRSDPVRTAEGPGPPSPLASARVALLCALGRVGGESSRSRLAGPTCVGK